MAKVVAMVTALTGMTDQTHFQGQASYVDVDGNNAIANFSVAIGLTLPLTNLSIAADVANACNDAWSTSWATTDVLMCGGPTLLAT